MGGLGSGSWTRWNSKKTTESQHGIDIRKLKKDGCLATGATGSISWSNRFGKTGSINFRVESNRIILMYRHRLNGGEWESIELTIMFEMTPCNYGGSRTWLLCPGCGKRVALLYGAGRYFLCRRCHNLNYASQHEGYLDRHMRKARDIRRRLGGDDNLFAPFPSKPKNMHWKTYWRLRESALGSEYRSLRSLEITMRQLQH